VSDGASPGLTAVARGLLAPVYLPWVGMALCLGMVSVALPLYLTEVGLGYLPLSAVLTAAGVGSMVGGIPAGDGVARLGERRMLVAGIVALAATTVALSASDQFVVLVLLQFTAGVGAIAMRLAGQTWIAHTAASTVRGRLLSAMGGIRRFGAFVGPALAGVLIDRFGFTVTFAVAGASAGLGLVAILASIDRVPPSATVARLPLGQVLARHWRRLLIVTSGPILIMAARRGRGVVLPLIGDDLGLSPTTVGLLVSVSTGADLLLFPVAGYLMDAFGRLTAIIPAFSLMGIGLFALALADGGLPVALAGALIGVGNGLSSGTMMTLGTDLAPEESTSQFLAGFSSLQDWGQVAGPLIVGWVATWVGLAASAGALGVVLFVGLGLIVWTVGETRVTA
jgi:MFS family permease